MKETQSLSKTDILLMSMSPLARTYIRLGVIIEKPNTNPTVASEMRNQRWIMFSMMKEPDRDALAAYGKHVQDEISRKNGKSILHHDQLDHI